MVAGQCHLGVGKSTRRRRKGSSALARGEAIPGLDGLRDDEAHEE